MEPIFAVGAYMVPRLCDECFKIGGRFYYIMSSRGLLISIYASAKTAKKVSNMTNFLNARIISACAPLLNLSMVERILANYIAR